MKTKIQNKADDPGTRNRIIEAAAEEFAEHGLAGARVDRIAETASANKAMIYYHFGSKEKLYQKTIEEHIGGVISSLKLNFHDSDNLHQKLSSIAATYSSFMSSSPTMRRIFLRELANPKGEIISKIADLVRDSGIPKEFQSILKDGQKEGHIKEIDHRQAVAAFISMNIGFYLLFPVISKVLGLKEGNQMNKEREQTVVNIFLEGIKK